MDKALPNNELFYRAMVEEQEEIVCQWSPDTTLTFVNQSYCVFFDKSCEELIGTKWLDLVPEPERNEIAKDLGSLIKNASKRNYECQAVNADGQIRWQAWIDSPIFDNSGKLIEFQSVARDITQYKELEIELRKECNFAQSLINTAQAIVLVLDTEGRIIRINPYMEQLSGYRMEEVAGKDWFSTFLPGRDHEKIRNIFKAAANDTHTSGNINPILTKDGCERQIIWYDNTLRDIDGEIIGVLSVGQDITERLEMERELKKEQDILRSLASGLADLKIGVDIVGTDYRIKYQNKVLQELFGRNINGLCYQKYKGLEEPCNPCPMQRAVKNNQLEYMETTDKNGRDYQILASPLPNPDGSVDQVIEVIIDITERKKHQEEIAGLARFPAENPNPVMRISAAGIIVYTNAAALKMMEELYLQSTPEEIEGWREVIAEIFNSGKIRSIESKIHGRLYDNTFVPEVESGYINIYSKDITEQKNLAEQLRQSEKMQAIGQLAGGIAHDFNNQLTGIIGYSDMILANLEEGKLRAQVGKINNAARRSADLTAQLLAFARKGKYQSEAVDMHVIIAEAIGLLARATDKGINIKQFLEATHPTTIGDASQLQSTILNIAINARDAILEEGEIIITTSVKELDENFCKHSIYPVMPGQYLEISISDNGMGMDEETQKHIFEPFFTTKDVNKGTGMGLPAVDGTVRSHKGAISLSSNPGEGTTFTLYLPSTDNLVEEKTVPKVEGFNKNEVKNIKTGRVLLVDDEPIVCEMVGDILREIGYNVTTIKDGSTVLDYYQNNWQETDIIILDMIMPEISGYEIFSNLREVNPEAKIILSSGYSIDDEVKTMLERGASAFIQKPYQGSKLSQLIQDMLGQA